MHSDFYATMAQVLPLTSRDRLGDVATAAGDLTAARDHYQAALDTAARLAAVDPANARWQRDLADVRQRIADLGASNPRDLKVGS